MRPRGGDTVHASIQVAHFHVSTSQPPGVPHAVVLELYTAGCSRHCSHCHNKQLWSFTAGNRLTSAEAAHCLDGNFAVGAVGITGGEPLEQPGIVMFCRQVRQGTKLPLVVYTNGLHPDKLAEIITYRDCVVIGGPTSAEITEDELLLQAQCEAACREVGATLVWWRQ